VCMAIYVASDHPLPTKAWDENQPGLFVVEVPDHDEAREQFSRRHVYYVGSHQGCGCGFSYGRLQGLEEDPGELAATRASRRGLSDLLTASLAHQVEVEVYACWNGDETIPPEHRGRVASPDSLRARSGIRERELLIVRNDAP